MKKLKHLFATFTALVIICIGSITASASGFDSLPKGTHQIKAELSCYVNAMGGVEFGAPLLSSATVEVAANGRKTLTLHFTKSRVTIYGITCDTFIDVSPSYVTETNGIKSGTLGFYNSDGTLVTDSVTYTLSNGTAENSQKEQVHYVDSVSFPVDFKSDTYNLTLFVNSNVMGTQFTKDGYAAVLTVDWSSVSAQKSENEKITGSKTESKKDTEPTANSVTKQTTAPKNTESKNGLNIYQAEKSNSSVSNSEQSATNAYIAHFKEPILLAVGIAAAVLILGGTVLVIVGKKERKS